MISKPCLAYLRQALRRFDAAALSTSPNYRCAIQRARHMATVSDVPQELPHEELRVIHARSPPEDAVLTTMYDFRTMEPLQFLYYNNDYLKLPTRRDILHRAIVYEGDMARQGTASTKWRSEVHGSHRKILPQKGTGRARVGDKQSPIRRGGGVAFGPKPRDFSTDLPRKIYDLAWRTALSYRYARGELVIVDQMNLDQLGDAKNLRDLMLRNGLGVGAPLLVPYEPPELKRAEQMDGMWARIRDLKDVDVKNLLEMRRVVIERKVLDAIIRRHMSDLFAPFRTPFKPSLSIGADANSDI